jgi:hypothetical protein
VAFTSSAGTLLGVPAERAFADPRWAIAGLECGGRIKTGQPRKPPIICRVILDIGQSIPALIEEKAGKCGLVATESA